MLIQTLAIPSGDAVYYSTEFRNILESFMSHFRTEGNYDLLMVDDQVGNKYEGDLYGLLQSYSVPQHMQWVIMRVNEYTSPTDYVYTGMNLKVPKLQFIDKQRQIYQTNQ